MAATCLTNKIILDLGQLHPGPHTAMLLGQLGATVIKVERPHTGDTARALGAGTFAKYNRGKLSIALDLKDGHDRAILLRLARRAHGLIEGFRPDTLERLGVGPDTLLRANPALVVCAISGFGQTGPYAHRPGHDLNYLALAGYWAVPSQIEEKVARPRLRLSDYCGSMYAALSMVVAIMTAEKTGKGQHLDVSLQDAMLAWTWPGIDMMRRSPSREACDMPHIMPDNDLFETADGAFIALGILEPKFWDALRSCLGGEYPALCAPRFHNRDGRMRNKHSLHALLKAIFAEKTRRQWAQRFEGSDIPWAPLLDCDEVAQDVHFQARHPDVCALPLHDAAALGFPVRFSQGLPAQDMNAPELDAHRGLILDWLEDMAQDVPRFRSDG
ncbi:CoA transferase [Allopusillimonas soli]|uniref:CoA transferase n=1 Tax=Allopusillimonas soli TaxID=659016 RepID=A0A853F659_9BURK|nr:CaiB/BaiF CoA-transferase family protein [Allopusillimonas soli]NYT35328.1 CoA transferase [Allopusillimonas soli]TEA75750.1 CoA transferase [Allopusillimonas soli]